MSKLERDRRYRENNRERIRLRARAARKDPARHTHRAPTGYALRGASTLLDGEGKVVAQWVKTAVDPSYLEDLTLAIADAVATAKVPAAKVAKVPATSNSDLLAVYPFGDPHFGMLAWAPEAGQDFDIGRAEKLMLDAMGSLVSCTPSAEEAWIINLGDMLHADNHQGTTAAGTKLDTDTRYPKALQAAVRALVTCTNLALRKHARVRVTCAPGNHDAIASVALRMCLAEHYRNEPRVAIDPSPAKFTYLEYGRNLLGVHHGDTCKPQNLPGVMATDAAQAWGRTTHRRWYCGHVHHDSLKEYAGVTVETFRTLAPKDAWHAAQGYRSAQGAVAHVWHRTRGLIATHKINLT